MRKQRYFDCLTVCQSGSKHIIISIHAYGTYEYVDTYIHAIIRNTVPLGSGGGYSYVRARRNGLG